MIIFLLLFLCPLLLLVFHPPSPPTSKHQDVQVTKLCIPACGFTGEHSKTPVKMHCTWTAFSRSQAYTGKPFNGMSSKILLGSETRREKKICQGSSTELLALLGLLAPPSTWPLMSSSPSFKGVFLSPTQSASLCISLWFLHFCPCLSNNSLWSLILSGHPQKQIWTSPQQNLPSCPNHGSKLTHLLHQKNKLSNCLQSFL